MRIRRYEIVPAAPQPSRTLRAASRCRPLAGILDRRVTLGGGLRWPNAVLLRRFVDIQPEHLAIVRTC
jgi:hypothetical protein